MAEYIVDTEEHGRVKVQLKSVPASEPEIDQALKSEIKAGRFQEAPSDQNPTSILESINRTYQSIAAPITQGVQMGLSNPINHALAGMGVMQSPPENPIAGAVAQTVVPQSPLEAGAMIGTMGAGAIAGKMALTGIKASLVRVIGSATGGEVGGELAGKEAGLGALYGAITGTVGEGVGAVLNRLLKFGSNRVAKIVQTADADNIGRSITTLPELGAIQQTPAGIVRGPSLFEGKTTPDALRELVKGDVRTNGYQILGDAQDGANKIIEGLLPSRAKFTSPFSPSHERSFGATVGQESDRQILKRLVEGRQPETTTTTYVDFGTARKELSMLYARAYGPKQANPETATALGIDPKELYHRAIDRMRSELTQHDPTAVAVYDAAREQFRVGRTVLESLKPAFKGKQSDRIVFDSAAVQSFYSNNQAKLVKQLGTKNYDSLAKAVFRQEKPGLVDQSMGGASPSLGLRIGASGPRGFATEGLKGLIQGPQLVGSPMDLGQATRTGITTGAGAVGSPLGDMLPSE